MIKPEQYSDTMFVIESHDIPGHGINENKWVKGYFYKVIDEQNMYCDTEHEARQYALERIDFLIENRGTKTGVPEKSKPR